MIAPQELRQNNLLEYDGRIFEIDSIAEEFPTLNTEEFGIGVVDWNNIQPIELTEEWLLKFGYVPNDPIFSDKSTFYTKGKHKIWYPFNQFLDECYRFEIKYVHQLQNLFFALTGEELTIKEQK